jgi:glycosyltransferase involved in cell wall biosynthesis
MKIVLIGPTYPYRGGISHFNTLIAKELGKKNEIKIFSYYRRYPSFLYPGKEQKDKKSKIKIKIKSERTLSMINPLSWIRTALKIRKFNPEKIIFHWVTPFTAIMLSTISLISKFNRNTKVVLICSNLKPHETNFSDEILTRFMFCNVDKFVVHSNEDIKILKEKFKQKNIVKAFVPSFDVFNFKKFSKETSRKILGLNKRTILFFGYVREYKGLITLLEAMPIILKKLDLDLVIAGEFWQNKKQYLEKIEELGIKDNIKIFDEYIPNEKVGLFFSACDAVVVPYKKPSQSAVVRIAVSFNKPVIVTNKVLAVEKIVINEATGFVVNDSKESIATAVLKFYKEKKEQVFSKNMEKLKENFSWKQYTEVLEKE